MEILTWSGDLEYETLSNALEAGSRTVPDKVLAGANLALRAETADGGSGQMQDGGGVESSRGTMVGMEGGWTGGWEYHGNHGTTIRGSEQ